MRGKKDMAELLGCVADVGEVKNYIFKFWRRNQGMKERDTESKQEQRQPAQEKRCVEHSAY